MREVFLLVAALSVGCADVPVDVPQAQVVSARYASWPDPHGHTMVSSAQTTPR
jgi:hypothetical protein